jgi:uncharacterized protein (TIGR02001 family)
MAAPALAEETAAAKAPDYTLTANVNLVSEYRFRGLAQTWGKPALQGGADFVHSSGFYAGVWGSNVSGNSYAGGSLELDYYGGYNGKITDDLGWTVGGYGYYYPGANFNKAAACAAGGCASQTYDNFEINAGVSWKWISYKLSYATTDYFGANTSTGFDGSTKGTLYHDLSVNYPITDDWAVLAHVGRTDYKANLASGVNPDYTDYKLGVAKTFNGGWNASLAYIKATNDSAYKGVQSASTTAVDTYDLNKGVVVLQLGRTF